MAVLIGCQSAPLKEPTNTRMILRGVSTVCGAPHIFFVSVHGEEYKMKPEKVMQIAGLRDHFIHQIESGRVEIWEDEEEAMKQGCKGA